MGAPPEVADGADFFEEHWGQGIVLETIWAQGFADTEVLGRIERAMGTPKSMAGLLRATASGRGSSTNTTASAGAPSNSTAAGR